MECPRCSADSPRSTPRCAHCGLDLESLSLSLGSSLVQLESLTDAAHCLRVREREALLHELEIFHQAFPQVFFAIYLGVLPGTPTPSEIAFWLLNHAAFHPADPSRLNERAALLIIDPVAKNAGITVGYALEPFLPQSRMDQFLRKIRTPLWHGEYAGAISMAIGLLAGQLRKSARRTSREAEFPPPDADAGFLQNSGLQSLRHATTKVSQEPPL